MIANRNQLGKHCWPYEVLFINLLWLRLALRMVCILFGRWLTQFQSLICSTYLCVLLPISKPASHRNLDVDSWDQASVWRASTVVNFLIAVIWYNKRYIWPYTCPVYCHWWYLHWSICARYAVVLFPRLCILSATALWVIDLAEYSMILSLAGLVMGLCTHM